MLIGIAGAKRAGKTTLADHLADLYRLTHTSFAGPIREFVASLLGTTVQGLEPIKEEPIAWLDGVTPRQIMQLMGTEFGRQMIHPELWVRRALEAANDNGRGVVVSDVRFPNEAEAIHARGGIVLRVNRPGCGSGDGHVSETPLPADLVDVELENHGSITDLVCQAVSHLQSRFPQG